MLTLKRMSAWTEEEKAQDLERCFEKWEDLKQCFRFLLEKAYQEVEYEKEMAMESPRRMVDGFLADFIPRLDYLFSLFIVSKPAYGERYGYFLERVKPILDDYVKLNNEFNSNKLF